MANTGFPPSGSISPSVRIAEKDLSFVPPDQSFHRGGVVGFASKGPINIPTLISTRRQLNTVFGYPHPEASDPYMIYAAEQYLNVANELYVVRVGDEENVSHEQARIAQVDVPSAGGQIIIVSDTAEPYSFDTDSFFRWRLNGILSVKTLVVLADDNREAPLTGLPYTAAQLAEELNSQLSPEFDGIEFFVAGADDTIAIRTTFAFGPDSELEFVSVQDSILGGDVVGTVVGPDDPTPINVTGFGTGMTVADLVGLLDRYPNDGYQSAGMYDFTNLEELNLQVVVDGTDNVLIDQVVQVIDLTDLEGAEWDVDTIVAVINAQRVVEGGILPGGWEAYSAGSALAFRTLHHGRDARLLVKVDSTADGLFGFVNFTVAGDSPVGVATDPNVFTLGRINGDTNTTGDITFILTADSAGIDGNTTQVVIENNISDGTFTLSIFNNGIQAEAWGGLTKNETSRFYVETFLSLVSSWVRAIDNIDNPAPPLNGTYQLTGGSDGIPADPDDQDDLLIGNPIDFSGMYALAEPEQIDIDLLVVPGHSSTRVILAMLDVVSNFRQDCIAIIDSPFGLTVNEIVAWHNGAHPLNNTRLDSDFAALYWPWVKIRDSFNQIDVWAPPSGAIMAVYARSDQLSAPWFAPAGLTRGIVPNITDVFSRPTLAERDQMYGNRNAINPIISFPDVGGFVVWGQKTLQRRPTALDRVNVRRMLFVAEKRIRSEARFLLFEPHDDLFRQQFILLASRILEEIQIGRGLTDFIIQADDELNPPDVIDRNEFRARIGVQPTRAVEFIFIEFSIHRTGSFTENADTF